MKVQNFRFQWILLSYGGTDFPLGLGSYLFCIVCKHQLQISNK